MTIAEKLITIANNTPAVCASLATKESAITGNPAFASDVNSIEHNLEVSLTSDTITDFSDITVSRYGKNLWTNQERTWNGGFNIINENYNSISATVNTEGGSSKTPIFEWDHRDYKKWGSKITISFDYEFFNSVSGEYRPNEFMIMGRKDGISTYMLIKKLGGDTTSKQTFSATISIDTKVDYDFIRFGFYGSVLANDSFRNYRMELSNIQLELDSISTNYEPYNESQTAISNADGIVKGMKSLSPNMILVCDNNINIQCSYRCCGNKINNDKFIKLKNAFESLKETLINI